MRWRRMAMALMMALTMAGGCWGGAAGASTLYLFQPSGGGAIGMVQAAAVPDASPSAGSVAQFCFGTGGRCTVTFNDGGQGFADQVDLSGPGIPGAYDYYPAGAFSTPGFYQSVAGLFATSLAVINLPAYAAGSFVYVMTFGDSILAYLSASAIADAGYNPGGDALFCVNTLRCSVDFNNAFAGVSDQVDLYGSTPDLFGVYAYFGAGAFTTAGIHPSQAGLFPVTLLTIPLPDSFAQEVPEPATWVLLVAGLGVLVLFEKKTSARRVRGF